MKKGQKNPRASRNWIREDYRRKLELTVAEAADLAGVSVETVEDWLQDGFVARAYCVGPFKVHRESLVRWLITGQPQGGAMDKRSHL